MSITIPPGKSLAISQKSLDMIVGFEVTSPAVYERRYRKPIWPGGASGVTVGIGYDLGYYTAEQVREAWAKYVSERALKLMLDCRGAKGLAAEAACSYVQEIDIPYAVAAQAFHESTLPQFAAMVRKIYPGVEQLPPDAQGALLSLVYKRGADIDPKKDRRREMYNISLLLSPEQGVALFEDVKRVLLAQTLSQIAFEIRKMKRLWPTVKGLRDRRDKEADLVGGAVREYLQSEIVYV